MSLSLLLLSSSLFGALPRRLESMHASPSLLRGESISTVFPRGQTPDLHGTPLFLSPVPCFPHCFFVLRVLLFYFVLVDRHSFFFVPHIFVSLVKSAPDSE